MCFMRHRKSAESLRDLRVINQLYLGFHFVPVLRYEQVLPMAASRSELRSKPRRQFHYQASILIRGDKPFDCAIADISETGARIQLEDERELPEHFMLLLTKNGEARRRCRLVWRNGLFVGVEFPNVEA
jgi:hypothetical protein